MTATQPSIFDAPITRGSARKTDPATSQAARDVVKVRPRQAEVVDALEAAGGAGTLDTICEALPKRLRNSISTRIRELCDMGILRATDRTEMGQYRAALTVWEVVER